MRKLHVMDFISNQAIIPILVSKSALDRVRLFEDLLLVPIFQMADFRNFCKTFIRDWFAFDIAT